MTTVGQQRAASASARIALDARWMGGRGIGRYTETLYLGLNDLVPGQAVALTSQAGLRGSLRLRLPGYVLKEQIEIPLRVTRADFGLLHLTGGTAPVMKARVPTVVTVHDVMFFRSAHALSPSPRQLLGKLYRRFAFATGTLRAEHLIVVSGHVAEELRTLFPRDLPPLTVVRESPHPKFRPAIKSDARALALKSYGVHEGAFFLHLGGTDPRKNTLRVLEAFAGFCRAGGRSDLVVTGLSPLRRSVLIRSIPTAFRNRVRLAAFCPDAELIALMQSCVALVFVSNDEGFGLPVIEAMACGAAVIGSDIEAVREVAGDQ